VPRFAVVFLVFFAAVFLVVLLFAALLLAARRLLVAVVLAAAGLAALVLRVLRTVFKSPSMKVPTFFFVILGRDITIANERDSHA
jgi:hypothetical protein